MYWWRDLNPHVTEIILSTAYKAEGIHQQIKIY